MPYTKGRYRKPVARKPGKKKPAVKWYNRKYSVMSGVRYSLDQIYKLKGLINSEMHKFDVDFNGTALSTAGGITHLTGIAQGDTSATRTGNSIYLRSINGKILINHNSTATVDPQYVRLMLILDTQQIADTAPAVTDLLDNSSSALVHAHLNPATVGRFRVLWNQVLFVHEFKPGSSLEFNKAFRHHVRYNGANSTDIQRGAIYLVYMSNEPTNYPTMNANFRMSFHDN